MSDASSIKKLFLTGQTEQYKKGQLIYNLNAKPDKVFFIKTGYVGVYIGPNEDNSRLQVVYKSGNIFPFMDGKVEYPNTYFAISEVTILTLPIQTYNQAILDNLSLFKEVTSEMAKRIELYKERVYVLTTLNSYDRFINLLLFAANHYGQNQGGKVRIPLISSQSEIAKSIATTRETINRIMAKLEKKRLLSIEKSHLVIPSLQELKAEVRQSP